MVLPASGVMWVVDRDHEGWHREPVTGYRFAFVPLV
jgi:protein-L-isoaspartate(D-aspartate) O-methyltransferase